MKYNQTAWISSEILICDFGVGTTETGEYIYVWSEFDADEYTDDMIENPQALHGAMIGTIEEIVWEIENCVGGFRDHGDEEQQEASHEVVETLLEGLKYKEVLK